MARAFKKLIFMRFVLMLTVAQVNSKHDDKQNKSYFRVSSDFYDYFYSFSNLIQQKGLSVFRKFRNTSNYKNIQFSKWKIFKSYSTPYRKQNKIILFSIIV